VHLARRLTNAVASDAKVLLTVSEIVRLAHDREFLVVAAGVGSVQERDVLIEAGCDLAHGDLYGVPEPADNLD
jgi:EAL domain-containing protein (putative c-di-GMP-specific phosphodiesterase class I)